MAKLPVSRRTDSAGSLPAGELDLRAWTGRTGKVRTDQVHITDLLLPALEDYWTVPMGDLSDHDGVVVRLNLDNLKV